MTSHKPKLYGYFRSSCSWRVRIALELKGIEYEYKSINLIKDGGEQFSEEYTKINPKQEVPTLFIDGQKLVQSLAIIEYLDETRINAPRLLPKNSVKRAQTRAIAEVINSGIQPYQNANVTNRISQYQGDEKISEWINTYLTRGLRAIEELLVKSSGKFCVGDEITIADCCLVPQVYSANRFNVDLTSFPNVRRVCNELEKIPAIQKAHAHCQPDTPDNLRIA